MSENRYNGIWFNVYDNEDTTPGADKGDTTPGAGGGDKTYTQKQLNDLIAKETSKLKKANQDLLDQYNSALQSTSLSEEQRTIFEGKVTELEGQLLTATERTRREDEKKKKEFETTLTTERTEKETWKNKYHTSTKKRALLDAAVKGKAYNPTQIEALLLERSYLSDVKDDSGKVVNEEVKIKFPSKDKDGKPIELDIPPDEAIKLMKEDDSFSNLFISDAQAGLGLNNGDKKKAGGKVDTSTLTTEQYMKLRKENPSALGLK